MNLTTTLLATKAGGTQGIISMVVIYAAIIAIFWFFAKIGRASCRERV